MYLLVFLDKVTPDLMDRWANVMRRVEGSVIWLLRQPQSAEPNVISEFKKRGIAKERVVFMDLLPQKEHLPGKKPA